MKFCLVSSNNTEAGKIIKDCLRDEYSSDIVSSPKHCLEKFKERRYESLFIDIAHLLSLDETKGPESNYRSLLQHFWKIFPSVEIVILCEQISIRKAVEAVKAGASNYLTYPIDKKETRYIVDSTIETTRAQFELDYFREQFRDTDSLRIIGTKNQVMKDIFEKIKHVAPTNATVLIIGETGTGKGVVAKLIHAHGPRRNRQFISFHCGAIPENLIESELYGHEKGSFTGAIRRKMGKFEIAKDGTLFLDEIGTMPLSAQVKLLNVLQEKYFQRIGGEDNIYTDARIIAASNTNLKQMSDKGEFRKDLFFRLNVFPIELPPLRERREDIPSLAKEFLYRLNKTHSKKHI